jgi:hypothetical protein
MSERTKLDYPLKVEFKERSGEQFLIETGIEYQPIGRGLFLWLGWHLEIFELNSISYIGENGYSEELIGKARLFNKWSNISFFGCNRKLQYINISITSEQNINNLNKLKDTGFNVISEQYKGDKEELQDYEGLTVAFYIHNLQIQKIKDLLEKNLIKHISCSLSIPVDRIYVNYWGDASYKILHDKKTINNEENLPEDFASNLCRFYKGGFSIEVLEKSLFDLDKNRKLSDKLEEETENENNRIKLKHEEDIEDMKERQEEARWNEERLETKEREAEQIKSDTLKYLQYSFVALIFIVIILLRPS